MPNFSFKGMLYAGIVYPGNRLIHPRMVLEGYNITGHRSPICGSFDERYQRISPPDVSPPDD